MLDPVWDDAILGTLARHEGAEVFVERREDLSVEAATHAAPRVLHSLWGGACVGLPGRPLLFHSAVPPDRLEALAGGRQVEATGGAVETTPEIDPRSATGTIAGAVVEAGKRIPGARFRARWVEFVQHVRIGREGRVFEDCRRTGRFRVDGILERGGRTASAAAERVVHPGSAATDVADALAEAIGRLEARLDRAAPETGPVRVVFAPAIAGVWIHELVGHAAEADRVAPRRSWLNEDHETVPCGLTVVDDPRRARASWRIDDEGTGVRPVPIVQEGRLRERLHTRRTAATAGGKPTGHGRRGSFREPVLPRMGCTFIANGRDDPYEILKNVEKGIYVRRMESAHADPLTGRALFRVDDGDRILAGKLDRPLSSHVLEAVAGEALAAIDAIGNDLCFDRCIGTCHRDGQPLSTSVGAPTIRAGMMTVRF